MGQSQENISESGGEVGDGAGKRVMESVMCTERDEGLGRAIAAKVAEHGRACTKDRTGAVPLRAALESAVQIRRGDEMNRQAELANPTRCIPTLEHPLKQVWLSNGLKLPRISHKNMEFLRLGHPSVSTMRITRVGTSHRILLYNNNKPWMFIGNIVGYIEGA
jgi:hypothetical protein